MAAGGCSEPAASPSGNSVGAAGNSHASREPPAPATGPCLISGDSRDADPNGLQVRDAPGFEGAVLGRLYPAVDPEVAFHPEKNLPLEAGLIGAQFTIDRVSGDWLHITDIDPITEGVPEGGDDRPNYQGAGWVHASKVRLLPAENAVVREQASPRSRELAGFAGSNLYSDRIRVIDCRGSWANVEYAPDGGVTDRRGYSRPATGWLLSVSNRRHAEALRQALNAEAEAR